MSRKKIKKNCLIESQISSYPEGGNNSSPDKKGCLVESTKRLISPLLELGLNKYEARVYLALVTEGTSTAKNISNVTGIPYGKVYEIINALGNKGFCILLPTKPMKCKAVSPKEAVKKTKEKTEDHFQKLEKQIHKNLNPLFEKTKEFNEPKGVFWIVNGRSNIIQKVNELINKANNYIYIFTTENGLKRLIIHKNELQDAKKRNTVIKIAGCMTANNKEDCQSLNFCDLRHANKINTHLISVDGKESFLIEAIPDDDSIIYGRDLGVWIQNPSFTSLLEDSFLTKFNRSKPQKIIK